MSKTRAEMEAWREKVFNGELGFDETEFWCVPIDSNGDPLWTVEDLEDAWDATHFRDWERE